MSNDVKLQQLAQREAEILAKLASCDERPWPHKDTEKVKLPSEQPSDYRCRDDAAIRTDLRYHGDYYRG